MNTNHFQKRYGPWAVITGASDGIAYECAILGLNVALIARRKDVLDTLATDLRSQHQIETLVIPANLATAEGLEHLFRETGKLDAGLFVASAGYGTSGDFLECDPVKERDMLDLNCFAVFYGSLVFGSRFRQRGRGGLILLSSLVGWQGTSQAAHYAATKAYVQTLAEGIRIELGSYGIDVLASAPGPVRSGFAERANMRMSVAVPPQTVAHASLHALGRTGTVVPGFLSKALTWSLLPLPRDLRARIMGAVMANMTQHQRRETRT